MKKRTVIPMQEDLAKICKHCGQEWGYHHAGSTEETPFNACPDKGERMSYGKEGTTFEEVEDESSRGV